MWIALIEKIVIRGFKSLKNVSIQIKPITVLIGLNSSGKTSVLQALEVLKQSATAQDSNLRLTGDLVNLGSFVDVVFQKEKTNEILFEVEGQREQSMQSPFGSETRYSYSLLCDQRDLKQQRCTITSGQFRLEGEYKRGRSVKRITVPFSNGQLLFDPSSVLGRPFNYAGISGPLEDFDTDSLTRQFLLVIQQDLHDFFMVPAIRGVSSPSYPLDTRPSEDLMDVSNLYQQAIKFSSTVVYNSPAIERKINKWISRITGIAIRARTIPDKQASIEAVRKMDVNIVNEGFGSNQLVHLFAQIATAPQHALIGIEEPEVHLHPKAQSELAKVLIEIAGEEKKNLILTTHSEHILYRLLMEVARGSLKPENLAIYHFRLTEEGITEVELLEFDKEGRLDKGIPDFLESDLDEFKGFLAALKAGRE